MPRTYTAELKAKVIAEWKAGASLNQLAALAKAPKATVQSWVRGHRRIELIPKKTLDAYDFDTAAVQLIDGSVRAFQAILAAAEDASWIKGHSPSEAAILAGVIADKLYRLLGAIERKPVAGDDREGEALAAGPGGGM